MISELRPYSINYFSWLYLLDILVNILYQKYDDAFTVLCNVWLVPHCWIHFGVTNCTGLCLFGSWKPVWWHTKTKLVSWLCLFKWSLSLYVSHGEYFAPLNLCVHLWICCDEFELLYVLRHLVCVVVKRKISLWVHFTDYVDSIHVVSKLFNCLCKTLNRAQVLGEKNYSFDVAFNLAVEKLWKCCLLHCLQALCNPQWPSLYYQID